MKTLVFQMYRWEYFHAMGNNCRLHGMSSHDAQSVIEATPRFANDTENFWTGFMYGRDDCIVSLPSIDNVI
jgi:hypothetical protein